MQYHDSSVYLARKPWLVCIYFKWSQTSVVTDLVKQVLNAGGPFKDSCKASFFLLEHTVSSLFQADALQSWKTCLTAGFSISLLPLGQRTRRDFHSYRIIYLRLFFPPPGAEHVKRECLFLYMASISFSNIWIRQVPSLLQRPLLFFVVS